MLVRRRFRYPRSSCAWRKSTLTRSIRRYRSEIGSYHGMFGKDIIKGCFDRKNVPYNPGRYTSYKYTFDTLQLL